MQLIARQLAAGFDASGWAQRKLAAVQALRRTAQAVVDELGDLSDKVCRSWAAKTTVRKPFGASTPQDRG